MADNNHIRIHCLQCEPRVEQTFSLVETAPRLGKRMCVGREPLAGHIKGGLCPCTVLHKKENDRPSLQGGHLTHGTMIDFLEASCEIQQMKDILPAQLLCAQQIFVMPQIAIICIHANSTQIKKIFLHKFEKNSETITRQHASTSNEKGGSRPNPRKTAKACMYTSKPTKYMEYSESHIKRQ